MAIPLEDMRERCYEKLRVTPAQEIEDMIRTAKLSERMSKWFRMNWRLANGIKLETRSEMEEALAPRKP